MDERDNPEGIVFPGGLVAHGDIKVGLGDGGFRLHNVPVTVIALGYLGRWWSCRHRLSDWLKRLRDVLKNVLAILTWVCPPL